MNYFCTYISQNRFFHEKEEANEIQSIQKKSPFTTSENIYIFMCNGANQIALKQFSKMMFVL